MSHYFETPTSDEHRHQIEATIWGRHFRFFTANGVFSGSRLDPGTAVLLRSVDPPQESPSAPPLRLLDLGCGFGPIAVALAAACPGAQVSAIDVNERAVELTRDNAAVAGVDVTALHPDDLPADTRFDEIWSNPPIRIGKDALHRLLGDWLARLDDDGRAYLVVGHHLGADSLQAWLRAQGWDVQRLASAKGYRVLRVSRAMITIR